MADQWKNMAIPDRPSFPEAEQPRVEHCAARECVLDDDWDDIAFLWRQQYMDPTVEATMGPPDTSRNALHHGARQLTTPGLYGREPQVTHLGSTALVEALQAMGWATKMQEVQFKAVGMGDYAVHVDQAPGGLQLCPVSPADHWVDVNPETPDAPLGVWHLRLRWYEDPVVPEQSGYRWAWDVWHTQRDELTGEAVASYRVLRPNPHYTAESDEPKWLDDSALFLLDAEGNFPEGGWVGDGYVWRDEQGQPFLPWVWYRAHDTGKTWNYHVMRGLHRGTLMTSLHWSYASKAALSASGKFVLCVGVAEPAGQIKEASLDGTPVRSIGILPGTMMFASKEEDFAGQPLVQEVGPGSDLADLVEFCTAYEVQQMQRWGIAASDIQRVSDTPASGVSLHISSKGRREFQARIEPLFRRADTRLFAIVARLLALTTGQAVPTTGYGITYTQVPLSPQEHKERREDANWRRENGHASEVDLYLEAHPGLTREQALDHLVAVQLEQAELAARVAESQALLAELAMRQAQVLQPEPPPQGGPQGPDADTEDNDDQELNDA